MWVRERDNGKFQFLERYVDPLTGKRKEISVTLDKNTTHSRKLAEQTLQQKIQDRCSSATSTKATLLDMYEAYQIDQKNTVKASTYTRNFSTVRTLLKILGANTLTDNLNAQYVRSALIGTGEGPGTLNEYLKRFKAFMRWGYRNDFVRDVTWLDKLERFKDKSKREKIADKYMESSEVKILLHQMEHKYWKLLTEFLVLSGLRFGEAAALTASDVDTKKKVIHVNKTFDFRNELTTPPKTFSSNREVFIQPELANCCKQIKIATLQTALMEGHQPSDLFVQNPDGSHVHYWAYNKYLRENAEICLHRRITVHTLRHTHASLLMAQGVNIDTISRRLGHEDSRITKEIYLHVTKQLRKRDNEQLKKVNIL